MSLPSLTIRQKALLAAPPLLLLSAYGVFRGAGEWMGPQLGYLIGFLFYWLVWCLLLPGWVLGWYGLRGLFTQSRVPFGRPAWLGLVLLAAPVLVAGLTMLPAAVTRLSLPVLAVSAGFGLVNGTMEEVLWRGAYTRAFPGSWLWGLIYPAVGFGFWHLAPQSLFPFEGPGGPFGFAVQAIFLGLAWGWVARKSGSIRWVVIAHILLNWAGLVGAALIG